jgi:hypothetical protein
MRRADVVLAAIPGIVVTGLFAERATAAAADAGSQAADALAGLPLFATALAAALALIFYEVITGRAIEA